MLFLRMCNYGRSLMMMHVCSALIILGCVIQAFESKDRVRFPDQVSGQENGRYYIQGHVEIFHNNEWGTICDDGFDSYAAKVLCRMAGYKGGAYRSAFKQPRATKVAKIWLSNMQCIGTESSIYDCAPPTWNPRSCYHNEDVGIRCFISESITTTPLTTQVLGLLDAVRFPNQVNGYEKGRAYIQGHVEIFHNNQWGTICDDEFDSNDAKVICRMAGHIGGTYRSSFKQTLVVKVRKIWVSNLRCFGTESNINACTSGTWSPTNCRHWEDVGIRCYISGTIPPITLGTQIRFPKPTSGTSYGKTYVQGAVEISHNGVYGTICDDHFDDKDATVVCRMGGFQEGAYRSSYKQSSVVTRTKIWLDDLRCTGRELHVRDCTHTGWGNHDCSRSEAVGIRCYQGGEMRFPNPIFGEANGRSFIQGHVEVRHNGIWGTICDSNFDDDDAIVACKMGGYEHGEYDASYKQRFVKKSVKIWLTNVRCYGTESHIRECTHGGWTGWGTRYCDHNDDVGIRCYGPVAKAAAAPVTPSPSFNLTACVAGVAGLIAFITIIVVCSRRACSTQTIPPVSYDEVNLQERPPLMSDVALDTHTSQMTNGIHDSNRSISASAPPIQHVQLDEEEHELPQDSTLTEISDGPPRYRSMFPPGHIPVISDEGLPPPPTYEDAVA